MGNDRGVIACIARSKVAQCTEIDALIVALVIGAVFTWHREIEKSEMRIRLVMSIGSITIVLISRTVVGRSSTSS
jgi:hypothetical protein